VKKAISPVIATVIIVAVTIAIAIAVALWMSGLVGSFTATENIQIISAYAEQQTGDGWKITLEVKNVGTTDATIDNIFINGKPVSNCGSNDGITVSADSKTVDFSNSGTIPLPAGQDKTITITIPSGTVTCLSTKFTSGQMVEVKLHTASGKEYPKQVTLP